MEEIKSETTVNNNKIDNSKKKKFYTIIIIIAIIIIILYFFYSKTPKPIYQFKGDKVYYSQERGNISYEMSFRSDNGTFEMYNVSFYSRNFLNYRTKIYGILLLPKNKENIAGVIYLPGGGVSKENVLGQVSMIAKEGYAVLVIDQRGIGETGGYYLSLEDDYKIFLQGGEPLQHLSVYDALASYDVLRKIKNVDKNNILIIGESMGGRYAIIAAAVDKRLKGVLIMSSSGFHVKKDNTNESNFLLSIDPDHYISDISPNQIIMMHGGNDTMVNLNDAKQTFDLAREPKKLYIYDKCGHGYCNDMDSDIKSSLKLIFGIKE